MSINWELLVLIGILTCGFTMIAAKRMSALIGNFRLQSLCLCLLTVIEAAKGQYIELYIVAALILVLKVWGIPSFMSRIMKTMKVGEHIGFIINPQLSLILGLVLAYLSWVFAGRVFADLEMMGRLFTAISFATILIGMFILITRLKALAQVLGLLVMENGIFLLASAVAGGMPFLVEMAIFFDVFVSVVIFGLFVYRINELFTGIDVDQLNRLRG
jgi:hydrogenase-4 component E